MEASNLQSFLSSPELVSFPFKFPVWKLPTWEDSSPSFSFQFGILPVLNWSAFRRFGAGGWPDGLPETSFRAEGSWNASGRNGRFINQKRTRAADGRFHIVPCKEFISGQAEPFLSRACRIATLSRPASRSGRFVKPRRGASLALASVASRNNFPGDG